MSGAVATLARVIATLEADGDEHGVATDLRGLMPNVAELIDASVEGQQAGCPCDTCERIRAALAGVQAA